MAPNTETKAKLGYAQFAAIPDDGARHEIIDGKHVVSPVPDTFHQTVCRRILFQLYEQIELRGLGVVFNSRVAVQLSEHDIVQPDLAIVLAANVWIVTDPKIAGVPELIVEIISPSSSQNDRVLKMELYQRVGVPEYWIVDPFDQTLQQFILLNGTYVLQPSAAVVKPTVIANVEVRLSDVW